VQLICQENVEKWFYSPKLNGKTAALKQLSAFTGLGRLDYKSVYPSFCFELSALSAMLRLDRRIA
jgi:hypothetical protein